MDPGLLVRMLGQWRFVASLGLDMVGFLAQLVALHRLPLFAVQAMIAANLAVTAVCATWLIGAALRWREWVAVGGVVTGVGLLGTSAGRRARSGRRGVQARPDRRGRGSAAWSAWRPAGCRTGCAPRSSA